MYVALAPGHRSRTRILEAHSEMPGRATGLKGLRRHPDQFRRLSGDGLLDGDRALMRLRLTQRTTDCRSPRRPHELQQILGGLPLGVHEVGLWITVEVHDALVRIDYCGGRTAKLLQ